MLNLNPPNKGKAIAQNHPFPTAWQALTDEEFAYFQRSSQVLREQLRHTEADPKQQVRMRLMLWVLDTGLETHGVDRALLDSLCREEEDGKESNG